MLAGLPTPEQAGAVPEGWIRVLGARAAAVGEGPSCSPPCQGQEKSKPRSPLASVLTPRATESRDMVPREHYCLCDRQVLPVHCKSMPTGWPCGIAGVVGADTWLQWKGPEAVLRQAVIAEEGYWKQHLISSPLSYQLSAKSCAYLKPWGWV